MIEREGAQRAHSERTASAQGLREERRGSLLPRGPRAAHGAWHAPTVVDSDAANRADESRRQLERSLRARERSPLHPQTCLSRSTGPSSTLLFRDVRRCMRLRAHPRRIPGRGCRSLLLRPRSPSGAQVARSPRAEAPWLCAYRGEAVLGAPRWWETGGRLCPGDGCQGWLSVSGARQGWAVSPASQDASGADERARR